MNNYFKFVLSLWLACVWQTQVLAQGCNSAIPEFTPSSAFTLNTDGTALHAKTGLLWARCARGQSWDGTTCTGTSTTHNWQAALQQAVNANNANYLGHNDWRLPNQKELASIVERRCVLPAINLTVFPDTPLRFWSASAVANSPGGAWVVNSDFGNGNIGNKSNLNAVRLVRGGQSFDSFDLLTPVVNGSCGVVHGSTQTTTPALLLCGTGTASSVTVGNTDYTWSCAGSNGGTTANCAATRNYVVGSSVTGGHGNISASQNVAFNATPNFTLTPDPGFAVASVVGTCGGTLNGNSFTTNAVTANCTVIASFVAMVNGACGSDNGQTLTSTPTNLCNVGSASSVTNGANSFTWSCAGSNGGGTANCAATRNYVVSSSVTGGHGSISASQNVAFNATPNFTLTPDPGFAIASVGGTCGGSRNGNNFTTNAVTANCTVIASFIASVNGACGSDNGQTLASTPTKLCNNGTASSVTSGANSFTWSCAGSNGGTTANCSANRFIPTKSHTGPTATGTGQATIAVSGGGQNCGFGSVSQFFVPVTNLLAGVAFPQGLVSFSLTSCTTGGTVNATINYPDALPAGAQYWKYGPTTGNTTPHWYTIPATIAGNTVSFTLTDGGVGDDDLTANGVIVDPSGPGVAVTAVSTGSGSTAIPTLTEWAMLLLVSALGLFGAVRVRRS